MEQVNFTYGAANDAAGLPATVSVFADSDRLRQEIEGDLAIAGFRIGECGPASCLLDGRVIALGDVVFLDCRESDARTMAALSRLDMRIAQSGSALVVNTSLQALESVFACLDQSSPQILVDAGRAERLVAVGRIMGHIAGARVNELNEDDRIALVRLSEQVDTIAKQIEGLTRGFGGQSTDADHHRLGEHKSAFKGLAGAEGKAGTATDKLPDPRLVRTIIAQRQARSKFFESDLFADPAWDMLLDLTAATAEKKRVSVTSLCIASGVPPTTALRWISQMTESGLFMRVEDSDDRRRAFIGLTERAKAGMAGFFASMDTAASAGL